MIESIIAYLWLAGACKTMVDYEIKGLRMWVLLVFWFLFYPFLIVRSFFDE